MKEIGRAFPWQSISGRLERIPGSSVQQWQKPVFTVLQEIRPAERPANCGKPTADSLLLFLQLPVRRYSGIQILDDAVFDIVDPAMYAKIAAPFPCIAHNSGATDIAYLFDDIQLAQQIEMLFLGEFIEFAPVQS